MNQCFKKSSFLETHEDFQFILEESLLSNSKEEIAKNVEKLVKSKGFQAEEEMNVYSNITLTCQGNDEWVFAEKEGMK